MSDPIFGEVLARGGAVAQTGGAAWLRALLDVESALAQAQVAVGLLVHDEANAVTAACADVSRFDLAAIAAGATDIGNPVMPVVRRLQELMPESARAAVHRGATSQDIMDTGVALLAARAGGAITSDLRALASELRQLAREHRTTACLGRTLGQHAEPTSFGLVLLGWASALASAEQQLTQVLTLPVQLGGAVGNRRAWGDRGEALADELARLLGLAPAAPWHAFRAPVLRLGAGLAETAAVAGKIGLDITLLASSDVAEVREVQPGRGGSTAMPHKSNPVAAVCARAAAARCPGLLATLYSAAAGQEHQRGAGLWHAEWPTLVDLLRATGTAVAWLRDSVEHLEPDAERMARMAAAAPASAAQPDALDDGVAAGARLMDQVEREWAPRDGVPTDEARDR
ncbi:MAG: lyase family protein [Actinomycetales bacterium]